MSEVAVINPKSYLPLEFTYIDLEAVLGNEIINKRTEKKESAPSRAQRVARFGDIFYQTVRPYQKNNYLFELEEGEHVFSTGYAQIRSLVNRKFLFYQLHTDKFVNEVLLHCTGTSYPAINSSDLSKIPVWIPTKKEEMEKLGQFFHNLNSTITLHQRELPYL